MIKLIAYLNFLGQSKAAMEFYKSVFGGELTVNTYKEAGMSQEPGDDDNVIHSELKTDYFIIMSSDGNKEHPVHMGDNIIMSLMGDDEEKLTEFFNKLAEGGTVNLPLQKQYWGDTYGQVIDKFSVHWAVNVSSGEQGEQEKD